MAIGAHNVRPGPKMYQTISYYTVKYVRPGPYYKVFWCPQCAPPNYLVPYHTIWAPRSQNVPNYFVPYPKVFGCSPQMYPPYHTIPYHTIKHLGGSNVHAVQNVSNFTIPRTFEVKARRASVLPNCTKQYCSMLLC